MRRMYCKYCGIQIDDNSRYCPQCGKKLNEDTETNTVRSKKEILASIIMVLCIGLIMYVIFGQNLLVGIVSATVGVLIPEYQRIRKGR